MAELLDRLRAALSDRYAVERELGSGGMATVYLARDLKHERQVAVKVLHPQLAAVLGAERFLREIKVTARLNHPHILPLLDSGEAGEFLFYVMPFAQGESLRHRLDRERQLPVDDALTIAREVADALHYAHGQGVIHRDIKPGNILVEHGHAVVVDFGIARAINSAGGDQLTGTGMAIGTTAYMSPEQTAGSSELDARSDLYSLGCVLYEMLAGEPPFTGATVASVVHQHLSAEPPAITGIRPGVPEWAVAAITRALAKTPADRFSSAARFAEALSQQPAPVSGTSASVARPTRLAGRLALVAGLGAVVVLGASLLFRSNSEAPTAGGAAHPRTAIAVLPLQNLSAETQHAYFAGGLHDELLTQLSRVAALRVISRTSVMSYAGPNIPPIKQIASELGVGSVVEASVQVVGNRLRVTVQLIDAATDAHLWAERYDRTLDDAFAIQSEVARQIVTAVGAVLSSQESRGVGEAPTANAEAYRLYLQGREYRNRPGPARPNIEIAEQLYERALALDPKFAQAHAALSEVHGILYFFPNWDHTPARAARQREEAETALRLAPDLPQAHFAMGIWHYRGQRDYPRALAELKIALAGLPNDTEVWAAVGQVTRRMGSANESVAAHERATQLSPLDWDKAKELAVTYLWVRRYPETVAAANRALSLRPDLALPALLKGEAYLHWQGQLDTLRAAMRAFPEAAVGRLQLLSWDRRADSMLQVSTTARAGVFQGQNRFLPGALYAAWAHQLRGDRAAARRAFESARGFLDSVLKVLPDDERVHAARGLALAGLGLRDEALREASWLQQSVTYREDKFQGPIVAENRAGILAQAGEVDGALDEIESLLERPSQGVSVHTLRLNPLWDPVRSHPRFQALLTKYAAR